jgi:hypothetical protein
MEKDPDKILGQSGYLRQWVNECVACHRRGCRPSPPPYGAYATLRRMFDELPLDEDGMCEQCRDQTYQNRQH